jgi:hypothetical protein
MDEVLKVTEKNGFSVIDVTPDKITFSGFMWRRPQPVEDIDMKPALVYEVPAKHEPRRHRWQFSPRAVPAGKTLLSHPAGAWQECRSLYAHRRGGVRSATSSLTFLHRE